MASGLRVIGTGTGTPVGSATALPLPLPLSVSLPVLQRKPSSAVGAAASQPAVSAASSAMASAAAAVAAANSVLRTGSADSKHRPGSAAGSVASGVEPTDDAAAASAPAAAVAASAPAPTTAGDAQVVVHNNAFRFELQPRVAYSAHELQGRNAVFSDDQRVILPVGRHLWHYDTASKNLSFFARRSHGHSAPVVVISANRARLAVVEDGVSAPGTGGLGGSSGGVGTRKATCTLLKVSNGNLLWKFSHSFIGSVRAVALSHDGLMVAVAVEFPRSDSEKERDRERAERADLAALTSDGKDEQKGAGAHRAKAVGAIAVWKADIKKLVGSKQLSERVCHATFHPDDSNLLCVSGERYLRYLKVVGAGVDEVPLLKRHKERSHTFVDHCWVSGELLVAVTDTADICVFARGHLTQTLDRKTADIRGDILCVSALFGRDHFVVGTSAGLMQVFATTEKTGADSGVSSANKRFVKYKDFECKQKPRPNTSGVAPGSAGAAAGANANGNGNGSTTNAAAAAAREGAFSTDSDSIVAGASATAAKRKGAALAAAAALGSGAVTGLSVSPNQLLLCASVRGVGLLTFPLAELGKWSDNELVFGEDVTPCGPVTCLDVNEQRALVVTCGRDCTVRIWDHLKGSKRVSRCVVTHYTEEPPVAVTMHPDGFRVLVGFRKFIAFYHVLLNGLHLSHTFAPPVPMSAVLPSVFAAAMERERERDRERGYSQYDRPGAGSGALSGGGGSSGVAPNQQKLVLRYSTGGHKFAVGVGLNVFIYNAVTLALLQHISGNNGPITSVRWSAHDLILGTTNASGACYAWELHTRKRIYECVDKSMELFDLAVDFGRGTVAGGLPAPLLGGAAADDPVAALAAAAGTSNSLLSGAAPGSIARPKSRQSNTPATPLLTRSSTSGGGAAAIGSAGRARTPNTTSGAGQPPRTAGGERDSTTLSGIGSGDDSAAPSARGSGQAVAIGAGGGGGGEAAFSGTAEPGCIVWSGIAVGGNSSSFSTSSAGDAPGSGAARLRVMSGRNLMRDVALKSKPGDAFDLSKAHITALCLDASRSVLIAGTSTGFVLLFAWPFEEGDGTAGNGAHTECYARYAIHDGPVTQLALMREQGVLFSSGDDGHLFVMDLGTPDGYGAFVTGRAAFSAQNAANQVAAGVGGVGAGVPALGLGLGLSGTLGGGGGAQSLLSHTLSASKRSSATGNALGNTMSVVGPGGVLLPSEYPGPIDVTMVRLSAYEQTIRDSRSHALELQRIQSAADFQLRATKDHYNSEIRALREDMEVILKKKDKELDDLQGYLKAYRTSKEQEKAKLSEASANKLQDVTLRFESALHGQTALLTMKGAQLQDLEGAHRADVARWHERMQQLAASKDAERTALDNSWQHKYAALQAEMKELIAIYEEEQTQAEVEHDQQFQSLAAESDVALTKARENTAKAFAETANFIKKFDQSQKALEGLKGYASDQFDDIRQMTHLIKSLRNELALQKRQARQKEEILTRSQHELTKARKDNSVLLNFVSVLEHRIEELEGREEPELDKIMEQKAQIQSMEAELFEQHKENQSNIHIANTKTGLAARLLTNVTNLNQQLSKKTRRWDAVVKELRHIVEKTSPKDWPQLLQQFYHDYIAKTTGTEDGLPPSNKPFLVMERQRRHLEKTLSSMNTSLQNAEKRRQTESKQSLNRNTLLLTEVNELREQNKKLEMKCKHLMSLHVHAESIRRIADHQSRLSVADKSARNASPEARALKDALVMSGLGIDGEAKGAVYIRDEYNAATDADADVAAGDTEKTSDGGEVGAGAGAGASAGAAAPASAGKSLRAQSSQFLASQQRPGTTSSGLRASASARTVGTAASSGGAGRVMRGTTQPLSAAAAMKTSNEVLRSELEDATVTVQRQQLQIVNLSEQLARAQQLAQQTAAMAVGGAVPPSPTGASAFHPAGGTKVGAGSSSILRGSASSVLLMSPPPAAGAGGGAAGDGGVAPSASAPSLLPAELRPGTSHASPRVGTPASPSTRSPTAFAHIKAAAAASGSRGGTAGSGSSSARKKGTTVTSPGRARLQTNETRHTLRGAQPVAVTSAAPPAGAMQLGIAAHRLVASPAATVAAATAAASAGAGADA